MGTEFLKGNSRVTGEITYPLVSSTESLADAPAASFHSGFADRMKNIPGSLPVGLRHLQSTIAFGWWKTFGLTLFSITQTWGNYYTEGIFLSLQPRGEYLCWAPPFSPI